MAKFYITLLHFFNMKFFKNYRKSNFLSYNFKFDNIARGIKSSAPLFL